MHTPTTVDEALALLGTERLMLQIHDSSFPGTTDEDVGRGTPNGPAGRAFLEFARSLGFMGIQLGPQGQTSRDNPSPYDSTAFSRSALSISFAALRDDPDWSGLVDERLLDEARDAVRSGDAIDDSASGRPTGARTSYRQAFDAQVRLCNAAWQRYRSKRDAGRISTSEVDAFRAYHAWWLEPDAMYEVLSTEHGTTDWRGWDTASHVDRRLFCPGSGEHDASASRLAELRVRHADAIGRYGLIQFLAHRQHDDVHAAARRIGLSLYADLQVGLELRDRWRLQPLFLQGYLLGAPPSRTNREGQPWGYPVLDPELYFRNTIIGSGIDYVRSRALKLFDEFDGIRIDHPQGLVCPWVYAVADPDSFHAVQTGARLFSSPELDDHPSLARYAIARPDQLADPALVERYADGWVLELTSDQVDRYATVVSAIVGAGADHGHDPRAIACETLSTQPYPLKRVMEKFGLGRFRVTQKMDVTNPEDVYRTDNARPDDWVMMGNHDTRSIWDRAAEWRGTGGTADRAAYLARRLAPAGAHEAYERRLREREGELVHAYFADLLASDAKNALVFFADLFGLHETYNAPGTVGPENWSLRVPSNYAERYTADAAGLRALNLPYACALALRSPLTPRAPDGLLRALDTEARRGG